MKVAPSNKWNYFSFKEVAEVVTGATPSKAISEHYGGKVPFVTPTELGADAPICTAQTTLSELGASRARLLPPHSVLVCCIGSLGKVGILGEKAATNQQINALVFDQTKVAPRYGYHYCKTLAPTLINMAPATTVAIVNKSRFQELTIPLPPLPEQKRIAAILDKADAIKRKRQQSIRLLDDFLRATFLDMFGDPVTNPKGWEVRELEELCFSISDIDHKMPKSVESGVPFISAKDLLDDGTIQFQDVKEISKADFEKLSRKGKPHRGDIIYSRIGARLGKARLVNVDFEFLASYSCCTIKPDSDLIDRQFLCNLLDSPYILRQAHGGVRAIAVPDLGLGMIKAFKIITPPLDLQRQFAAIVQTVEKQKSTLQRHATESDTLSASLQSRAFKGEL